MTSPNTLIADMQSEIDSTRSQLAAAQARILELRKALYAIHKWNSHTVKFSVNYGSNGVRDLYRNLAEKALATPDDDTALRKLVAKHILYYADKIEEGSEPL